jgi:hypothetical protein
MIEASKDAKFSLPHGVSFYERLLPDGNLSYVFRHTDLGELGRILILPRGMQSQICYEVVGEPDDPMTKKRREIFEPISKGISDKMTLIYGNDMEEPKPYVSPKDPQLIKSMVYPCDTCKAVTAMLIFAPDADTKAGLEDYARIIYLKTRELNVPTWIVGTETTNIVNGKDLRKSLVLKVNPEHEEARVMVPDELMDIIYGLMEAHCK